jgi:hypothetical protein
MEEEAWLKRDIPKVFLGPPAGNLTAEAFSSSSFILFCYHTATTTGQFIPIRNNPVGALFNGLLWGYVV